MPNICIPAQVIAMMNMMNIVRALVIGAFCIGAGACSSSSSPVAPTAGGGPTTLTEVDTPDARPSYASGAKPGNLTIVGIVLQDDGEFDVLQAAVVRAGLVEALDGGAQRTVFAPTDAAFVSTLGVASEAAAIDAVNGLPLETLTDHARFWTRVHAGGRAPRDRASYVWTTGALLMLMMLMVAVALTGGGQEQGTVRTVANVDLKRYAGEWFEIARYPNDFQKQCASDVRARYSLRDDGRIDVLNTCLTSDGKIDEAEGVARVVESSTSAKLEVRFAPALLAFLLDVWGDYWILGLAPDYSWAVVGSPDREYLWILSRTPTVESSAYEKALDAARANGFDVSRLVKTTHKTARGPSGADALR